MTLRYYASFITGAFVEIVTADLLWFLTKIPLHEVVFWSCISYVCGIAIVFHFTTPKKKKRANGPTIYTLTESGWKRTA